MTTRTLTTGRRYLGSTIEPSRAWIIGLTVGSDGELEWHGPLQGAGDAPLGAPVFGEGPVCECPDDCPRDHPNE